MREVIKREKVVNVPETWLNAPASRKAVREGKKAVKLAIYISWNVEEIEIGSQIVLSFLKR